MIQKKVIVILLALLPFWVFSQNQETNLSKQQLRKARPTYINIGLGLNGSKFRDFATSPLFYKGTAKTISISRLRADDKRESEFGSSYSFGEYRSSVNNNKTVSNVNTFSLYYSQLYGISSLSSNGWNVKVGALFNTTSNLRQNENLYNNGVGIEMFSTLFGSVKITRDISKYTNFGLFKLKPLKRTLSFRANIGLMNNTLRNGYAYTGQEGIINDENFLKSYKFNAFSGARFSTALAYTTYLKNNNGIRLSYEWDAYKTGGSLDKFEMSNHTFKIALLFNKR